MQRIRPLVYHWQRSLLQPLASGRRSMSYAGLTSDMYMCYDVCTHNGGVTRLEDECEIPISPLNSGTESSRIKDLSRGHDLGKELQNDVYYTPWPRWNVTTIMMRKCGFGGILSRIISNHREWRAGSDRGRSQQALLFLRHIAISPYTDEPMSEHEERSGSMVSRDEVLPHTGTCSI